MRDFLHVFRLQPHFDKSNEENLPQITHMIRGTGILPTFGLNLS